MHGPTSNGRRFTWLAAALLLASAAYGQQETEPAQQEPATSEPAADSGQVEANEDIYRQFMELKDGLQRRAPSPQDSWQSRSRLQKIDELPEESQKHLRNQLREIIVEGGAWQPSDQDEYYPYVPSEAAEDNYRLQNREAEAWGELLDNYHAREAQIHANAARSQAATAAMQGEAGGPGAEAEGQETKPGHAGQKGDEATSTPDSFAPGAQAGAQHGNEQGVAQSAMDFLQQSGYQAGSGQEAQPGQPGEQQQQGQQGQMAQQGEQGQEQQQGQPGAQTQQASWIPANQTMTGTQQSALQYLQQASSAGTSAQQPGDSVQQDQQGQAGQPGAQAQQSASIQAAKTDPQAAADASSMSPASQQQAGAEQSAMQYLQQSADQGASAQQGDETGQAGDQPQPDSQQDEEQQTEDSTTIQATTLAAEESADEGAEQSALEYLTGEGSAEEAQADTLSIQDLLNADGLGAEPPDNKEIPDKPDKDG